MPNKICIGSDKDSIYLTDDKIFVIVDLKEYEYELSSVQKMILLTTDMGPFYDDMGLAVEFANNNVVFIMSEHKCFRPFLFDQIGKALPIDFQKVIDASVCTEKRVFEIYVKQS